MNNRFGDARKLINTLALPQRQAAEKHTSLEQPSLVGKGCAMASIEIPISRHNSMYAPIKCLLNDFVKRRSLFGCLIHVYLSSECGIRRTIAGSIEILSRSPK